MESGDESASRKVLSLFIRVLRRLLRPGRHDLHCNVQCVQEPVSNQHELVHGLRVHQSVVRMETFELEGQRQVSGVAAARGHRKDSVYEALKDRHGGGSWQWRVLVVV